MNINLIIAALRQYVPEFANRVSGAADFDAAFKASGSATAPCAYVIPMHDQVQGNDNSGLVITLTENFGVYVLLDATADLRGQGAISSVEGMRAALWNALLGWQPEAESGPIHYEGGELVSLDRARLFYRFDFSTEGTFIPDCQRLQTLTDALPNFTEMRLNIDIISPAADANTPPVTDPALGGYAGGFPGPDGRIEHEVRIILPTS